MQPIDLQRNGNHRATCLIESLRARTYRKLFDAGLKGAAVACRGYLKGFDQMIKLALSEPADWFIAHTQGALPIAAAAAAAGYTNLGFDCEDLLAENGTDPAEIIELIQKEYLPQCDYISVPSESLGRRLAQVCNMRRPAVFYNVSPARFAREMVPPSDRSHHESLRLLWLGQTIGEGRGIEEAIAALGLLSAHAFELHLRGRVSDHFRLRLKSLSGQHGFAERLVFHDRLSPCELVKSMDQFDVGLVLERADHPNYSLTVTNKLFAYLLAGLAVAATDTPGHREVLEGTNASGFLYDAGNPAALADGLRRWIADPTALRSSQTAAWNLARERFCWEIEQEKFLRLLETSNSKSLSQIA
jgi:glycosyltransferase involved in cell wall biosynthesis